MNTIGEMKDIYVIARHVGISGSRIDMFLRTAEMAGYVLVRQEPAEASPIAAPSASSEEKK